MSGLRIASIALLSVALFTAGCSDNPVGRRCFVGLEADGGVGSQAIVASPALECQSRTCLRVPLERGLPEDSEYDDLCTDSCDSAEDCDRVPESPCQTGFTCAIATTVGPFCCEKLCVCKDYIVIPDGGIPEPDACNADDQNNKCCNLSGRSGLAQCQ